MGDHTEMRWTACTAASVDDEPPPSARSGHSATLVGGYVVVFGGTQGKNFRADTIVLDVRATSDVKRARWFRPKPAAAGGPGPRAFHSAVAVGTDLYVLCGRMGREQHGDVWVLDTTTWSWSSLADRFPSAKHTGVTPRDFGVASRVPNGRNVLLFGGFDGHRWLNDLNVLDVATGEWRAVVIPVAPTPRSGHAGDVVDSRVLLFGGQASNGQLCGDLWALRDADTDLIAASADALVDILESDSMMSTSKGTNEPESQGARWTRLHLRGQAPSPRTGHSVTAVGNKVVVFGGHGDDGWLVKQHVYYDDAHVVDRELGRWRRLETVVGTNDALNGAASGTGPATSWTSSKGTPLSTDAESRARSRDAVSKPSPRAFHSMTRVGEKLFLFGGFTGDAALSDAWWLEFGDEDAPERIATRAVSTAPTATAGGPFASPAPSATARFGVGSPPFTGTPFTGTSFTGTPLTGTPLGNVAGGVGRLLLSGLGAAVGSAARGVGGVGFSGAPEDAAGGSMPSVSARGAESIQSGARRANKERLLGSVLESIERMSAEVDAYPDVGAASRGHFFASCDPGDLRVGDLRDALAAYRRAVPAQGLGLGLGIKGLGFRGVGVSTEADAADAADREENARAAREDVEQTRGRFMHFSPENVRVGDIPALLAELQGALIAEAQEERGPDTNA